MKNTRMLIHSAICILWLAMIGGCASMRQAAYNQCKRRCVDAAYENTESLKVNGRMPVMPLSWNKEDLINKNDPSFQKCLTTCGSEAIP